MVPTFVDLSHIHEVETVECGSPSCSCEGDTCEKFLTSLFKTESVVLPPHRCSKKCGLCLCSLVEKLEESTTFRFTLMEDLSDEEVFDVNPEIAISRNENGIVFYYSSNMTFMDLVRNFKVKEIRSIKNYFEFHVHTGVTCGGCMETIFRKLNEEYQSKSHSDHTFFVRGDNISTKRFDVWSNNDDNTVIKMKEEVKNLLPEKFSISFYQYFEIQDIHCGGCERTITETLDLDQYRSFEFTERKYLRIESDDPILLDSSKKITKALREIKKPSKIISKPIVVVLPMKPKKKEESVLEEEEEEEVENEIGEEVIEIIFSAPEEKEVESETTLSQRRRRRLVLEVGGMTCGNCVSKVRSTLTSHPGVFRADVVLLTRKAIVMYDSDLIDDEETLMRRLTKIGYTATKLMEVDNTNTSSPSELEIIFCLDKKEATKAKVETVLEFFEETEGIELLEHHLKKKKKKRCFTTWCGLLTLIPSRLSSSVYFKMRLSSPWAPRRILEKVKEKHGIELEMERGSLKSLEATLLRKKELRVFFCQFLFSLFFTLPATIFALLFGNIHAIGGTPRMDYKGSGIYVSIYLAINVKTVVLFFLCTPVQVVSGFLFYKKSVRLLLYDRSFDKNTLITISCWVAYTVSIASVIYGMFDTEYMGKNYMEGSAMLICFLLLGRWVENLATRKTSTSLIKLMKLQPDKAFLCVVSQTHEEKDNVHTIPNSTTLKRKIKEGEVKMEEVDVNLLWPGDVVEVKIGCKIPTDGIVLHGTSEVNQAMVTGESVYVQVEEGSEVIGGTVNISHPLFIRITKSTQNNMLSKIVKMIEDAQANKPKIQDVLDKISLYFVPIVCLISVFVLALWLILTLSEAVPRDWLGRNNPVIFSILQATSTLVVACPCTLGLAVPLVIMVANGIGAKYGVLVKGGHVFEKLVRSDVVCFDKTGTLTQGNLSITKVFLFDRSLDQRSLMSSIAGCELSIPAHPIAQTIIDYVKEEFPEVKDRLEASRPEKFEHVNGQGLKCEIKRLRRENTSDNEEVQDRQEFRGGCDRLLIGNLRLLENNGVEIGPAKRDQIDELCAGKTRVFVSLNERIVAIFTLVDQLRPEIKKVVRKLREKYELRVMMLTGDHDGVALKIGMDGLGMAREEILSELTPIGKAERIRKLQRKGHTVVFIGDGVNDSVGLSQADVGISVKSGTEIAIECSNVVLMKKSMLSLLLTFHLAKRCYRRIKMNVFWAFLYNVITIPIAGGILFPIPGFRVIVPPWIAAVAMTLSCLCVTFNTILFRCVYRPPKWMKKEMMMEEEEEDNSKRKKEDETSLTGQ